MENDNLDEINSTEKCDVEDVEKTDVQFEPNLEKQSDEKNKKANQLCAISAFLLYGVGLLLIPVALKLEVFAFIYWIIIILSPLVGIIILIYLLAKYPEHKGGKILLIITVAIIIAAFIFLNWVAKQCSTGCFGGNPSCPPC